MEGIFRLSGSEKRIKELRAIFDSPDRYGKGLDWAGYTVHDAANVLRRYLNLLPEPIVPLDLYDRFRDPLRGHAMQAVGDSEAAQGQDLGDFDIDKAIAIYQRLITELPPLNRQLLLYILDLLAVFASKADENRMTSANLSAIFQPGMLSHPSHDMAPAEYRLSQDVLIFLIENQDHFLIGMRGTAADDQTVQEVQNGGTPPPGTPTTPNPSRSRNLVGRSASNASAGADSIRKFGGIRRNVSVSSKHSRQSNGAPSPASPAYGVSLVQTSSPGVQRSNTVPSKRSPSLPTRLQKNHESTSPSGLSPSPATVRGLSPASNPPAGSQSPSPVSGGSTLAPLTAARPVARGQEQRQPITLADNQQDFNTPGRERSSPGLFARSPTNDSDKKETRQPKKLRKKRLPGSSNPSAQSSTNSLHSPQNAADSPVSPTFDASISARALGHPQLETIPSSTPIFSETQPTPPATTEGPPPNDGPSDAFLQSRPQDSHHSSDGTLKPKSSPPSSLHSGTSVTDHSDYEHAEDAVAVGERREMRTRWRLSRKRDDARLQNPNFNPPSALGSNGGAEASTSSVGSAARPRKSFTTEPASSDISTTQLPHMQQQSSSDCGPSIASREEKKGGPIDWFKSKMREAKEEKRERDAEKERARSPPSARNRATSLSASQTGLSVRGKSMDVKRTEADRSTVEVGPPAQAVSSQQVAEQ